jgi:hypothetical protein
MNIFQVEGTDSTAVRTTFTRVSAFVKSAETKTAISVGIHLGDYIDLPAFVVNGYNGTANSTSADYGYINETNADLGGTKGYKLRLIVVGINSFQSTGSYVAPTENNVPHVVFQFQNLPGTQKMNTSGTNSGGYTSSLMRKYLVQVDGVGGNFLAGLEDAGVPTDVLWGPKRSMAKARSDAAGADCNVIEDLLWLPTEREMFGSQSYSALSETAANQAHLEYYDSAAKRTKYNMGGTSYYWCLASPKSDTPAYFCQTTSSGTAAMNPMSSGADVAPAFCVR